MTDIEFNKQKDLLNKKNTKLIKIIIKSMSIVATVAKA